MKVYAFQHDWPNSHNEWARQIWLWQQNWKQHGFEPVVLSLADAQKHPEYDALSAAVAQYPTVNDRTYEHACFVRHLAFDLAGAELISDYDVINRDWSADNYRTVFSPRLHNQFRDVPMSLDAGGNVCLAAFTPASRRRLLDAFLDRDFMFGTSQTHKGQTHISDMTGFMPLCVLGAHDRPICDTWNNMRRLWGEAPSRRSGYRNNTPPCVHLNNDSLVAIGVQPGNKSTVMADLILGRRKFFA